MARFRVMPAPWLVFLFSTAVACGFASWHVAVALASPEATLTLTSSSFHTNGEIPARFTCAGADASPALSWSDPPAETRSFALIMSDPDAPGGNFIHWVIYDLPASTRSLPEGVAPSPEAAGGRQGTNGFGKVGYSGPCPPPGKAHRYFLRLWALDSTLNLQHPSGADVGSAMRGHILARGDIMGRFRR
jgi:Raf kinase inhibitor-like YbhB/YbcL family protein